MWKPPVRLLISTGDPAGIGPEICFKALQAMETPPGVELIPVGDVAVLREAAALAGFPRELLAVEAVPEVPEPGSSLPVLHVPLHGSLRRGQVSAPAGDHTFRVLRAATEACLRGEAAGMVTCPVNKAALQAAGLPGQGHTEMLADLAGVERVETVFCVERLKIFFLSRHVSLREALARVTRENVLDALLRMDRSMRTLGCARPRLGVPGLNPHCGDGGLFGREDDEVLAPAVEEARRRGLHVEGPVGADSIYHMGIQGRYDAILSLYHDQGHIAAKTYDFFKTITLSLGLPFPRTSVDHGTGYDIAWQGKANPESLVRAVALAVEVLRRSA